MLLFTVQALGELAVLYPVNGAFFSYGCRFIDEAWYEPKVYRTYPKDMSNNIRLQGFRNGLGLRNRMAYRPTL